MNNIGLKKLLASASVAAFVAAGAASVNAADLSDPVYVPPQEPALPYISGVLSLYGGGLIVDSNDDQFSDNTYTFGGDGRIAGRSWMLEIAGSHIGDTDGSGDDQGSSYFAGAGHWLWRNPGSSAFGAFVGVDGASFQDSDDTSVGIFPGIEGAWFSGNQTYYGQLGGMFGIAGQVTDTWEKGAWGRLGFRHFFSPNSKIELDGLAAWGYFDSSDSSWGFGWGAEYEHQFVGTAFSGFGAYRGTYTEDTGNNDAIDHALLVGVRVRTGMTDLQTDYTDGASVFNTPAHHFHRWRAFPEDL